jgi:hypothetical protein
MFPLPPEFLKWYEHLRNYANGFPARGTISGALIVLERLKTNPELDIQTHTAEGGTQIRGASGEAIRQILASHGETRPFLTEGGRTNRGLRGDIIGLLDSLRLLGLDNIPEDDRISLLNLMQEFLVEKVKDFHNLQKVKFIFSPNLSTWENIKVLLEMANVPNKEGPVAQYLVGAKLSLRFPDMEISNESYSTADVQLGRVCDFLVGNTAIHVTVSPMAGVFGKCKRNLDQGYRPLLIVPHDKVLGSMQLAEEIAPGRIMVTSLESFISQNIEELSDFSSDNLKVKIRSLLDTYNFRVNQTEMDKSLLIEIPENL